jgi:hypothetical protein
VEQDNNSDADLKTKLKELLPKGLEGRDESERRRIHTLAGLQFETFMVEVLHSLVGRRGSPAERATTFAGFGQFDFLSEMSIADLPPPTAFEIKFFSDPRPMASVLSDLKGRQLRSDIPLRSIVFVTNQEPLVYQRKLFSEAKGAGGSEQVRYEWWGPSQIQSLINQLGDKGQEIVKTLPVAGLGAALRRVSQGAAGDGRESTQEAIISELCKAWSDDQLVFFLGAGVSIEAGVPVWGNLLASLYNRLLERIAPSIAKGSSAPDRSTAVETLMTLQDNSPLMSARTLRWGLGLDFHEAVRTSLYASVKAHDSEQLTELAQLCNPPRGRVGARAVVTYNFDDLLEQNLSKLKVSYLPIFSGNSRAQWTQLPVYHVHGLIPQQGPIPTDQTLIFSEEGYHTAYNNPYTWSNVVQLNLMTQYSCLFVGLSMTDPNLRRLLEIASAAQSGPRHVALLRRTKFPNSNALKKCISEDLHCALRNHPPPSTQIVDTVLAIHQDAWETTLKELGVRVLWFEDFAEIPRILARIREG